MNQSNREYLEANYHLWEQLQAQGTLRYVDTNTADNLLRIAREEFYSTYRENTTCPACVLKIFQFVFTNYDKVRNEIVKTETKQDVNSVSNLRHRRK